VTARSFRTLDVRSALGNPLEWTTAGKCLLGGIVMFCLNLWYWAGAYYALRHPETTPYLDRSFLALTFRVQAGLLASWAAVAATALWAQRRAPESRVLLHVTLHLGNANILVGGYVTGFYTSILTGVAALGGVAVVLILFDERAVVPAILSLIAAATALTIVQQIGLVPYAPLLVAAPMEGGRLSLWWLVSIGASTAVVFLETVVLLHFIVSQWRDHEHKLTRANDIISRYVASQLAAEIQAGNYAVIERRERRRLTLFFSDIKDFAATADTVEPEDLSSMLDDYLSEMTAIGERYGATIDKFVGDAIMIFFGAPVATSDRDHAQRAVQMAIDMQMRMQELRRKWTGGGSEWPFEVRMGINTGQASIGNFGSKGRLDYTAIGRQVNLAARLQAQCEPGGILISHSTWALVGDQFTCVPRGELRVKGFHEAVKAYAVQLP